MKLNEIRDNDGAARPRKIIGRGIGSGMGKTSTRGHKGAKARRGRAKLVGFEGGQMPLFRRLPKRGFKNIFRREFVEITLQRLQKAIDAGRLSAAAPIGEAELQAAGLFKRKRDGVRLLAGGELTAKVVIKVAGASKGAIAAIEKLGGSVELPAVAAAKGEPGAAAPSA